jgi:16S rRNA (guanine(966)-N(2))-methyltransferase RsmD
MRIISGEWRGRRLKAAAHLRPTGDSVRGALFSILGGTLSGTFVDLFAGTGAVGLEARSRGATVTLVERDPQSLRVLRANVEALAIPDRLAVRGEDVHRFLKAPSLAGGGAGPADVVFADPPWDHPLLAKLLRQLGETTLVGPATTVILEHRRGTDIPRLLGEDAGLDLVRQESYGDTALSFFASTSSRRRAASSATSVSPSPSSARAD